MPRDRFFVLCPLSAIAISALIAPRLQLFTNLVCKELDGRQWDPAGADVGRSVPCAADPVVQANVTKLLTSACYWVLLLSPLDTYYHSHGDGAGYTELLDSCLLGFGASPTQICLISFG
jgi:hypothetical protein